MGREGGRGREGERERREREREQRVSGRSQRGRQYLYLQ